MKQTSKTTRRSKAAVRPTLGNCSTEVWFESDRARPKTLSVTLERTTDGGYRIEEAAILSRINQFDAEWVRADVRALARDIKRRGLYTK